MSLSATENLFTVKRMKSFVITPTGGQCGDCFNLVINHGFITSFWCDVWNKGLKGKVDNRVFEIEVHRCKECFAAEKKRIFKTEDIR